MELEKYECGYFVIDCDLILDTLTPRFRIWTDISRIYGFNGNISQDDLRRDPYEVAQLIISREGSKVSINEVLLAYERILEREIVREQPRKNDAIVEMIKKYHQESQFIAISRIHKRELVLHYLSTSGLLNFFDLIITTSDISNKMTETRQSSHLIYHETIQRLKCEASKCLFFDDSITEQDKMLLPNYQFFDLKVLPNFPFTSFPQISQSKGNSSCWNLICTWCAILFVGVLCFIISSKHFPLQQFKIE